MAYQRTRGLFSCGRTSSTGVGSHFLEAIGRNPHNDIDGAFLHGHAYRELPFRAGGGMQWRRKERSRNREPYIHMVSDGNPGACYEGRQD